MSTMKVTTTEQTAESFILPGEHMLAAFLISKDPVKGYHLDMRVVAAAVEYLRTDELGRKAVRDCIDALVDEFKRVIESGGAK